MSKIVVCSLSESTAFYLNKLIHDTSIQLKPIYGTDPKDDLGYSHRASIPCVKLAICKGHWAPIARAT